MKKLSIFCLLGWIASPTFAADYRISYDYNTRSREPKPFCTTPTPGQHATDYKSDNLIELLREVQIKLGTSDQGWTTTITCRTDPDSFVDATQVQINDPLIATIRVSTLQDGNPNLLCLFGEHDNAHYGYPDSLSCETILARAPFVRLNIVDAVTHGLIGSQDKNCDTLANCIAQARILVGTLYQENYTYTTQTSDNHPCNPTLTTENKICKTAIYGSATVLYSDKDHRFRGNEYAKPFCQVGNDESSANSCDLIELE